MKIKKLNQYGIAHWVLPVLVVGVIGAIGTYILTASHADSQTTTVPTITALPQTAPSTSGMTSVGAIDLPQQNQKISAYACTSKIGTNLSQVKAVFTLSNSYKTPDNFGWTASLVNGGTAPITNQQYVYQKFIDVTTPYAVLHMQVSSTPKANPITFAYTAGKPIKGGTSLIGQVASNVYPEDLAVCVAK